MEETNSKRGRTRTRTAVPSIRALERGLLVLETLGQSASQSLSDVSRATGLSCSTTFRILETLRQRGYVEQDELAGRYRIGFRSLQLGSMYSASAALPQAAHPAMQELVRKINETVNLAILDGSDAVYVHQVEAEQSIRMFTRLGARAPLYCTGVGKVLLAWLPPDDTKRLLGNRPREAFTPTTRTALKEILADLAAVRRQSYAVDDEERERGIRCVTAPVRDAAGTVVAALSVSAPTTRLPKRLIPAWAREVLTAASQVSHRLGYHADTQ